MNDQQYIMEEQGIDIRTFLWALLEQWRGMVVTGIIFALLLAGARHVVNVRAARYARSQVGMEEETAQSLYKGQQNVPRVLHYYQNWQNQKFYYENSGLMKVDPNREDRYVIRYYITSDSPGEADFDTIEGCYRNMMNDEKFPDSMAGLFDPDLPRELVRELFLINPLNSKSSDDAPGRGFSVGVILPPREGGYDYDLIRDTITAYVKEKSEDIRKVLGDFDLQVIIAGPTVINYPKRGSTQISTFNSLLSAEKKFQSEYSSLTASEKASVNKIVSDGNVREWLLDHMVPQEVESKTPAKAASGGTSTAAATSRLRFPKKFAALGFLIGLFLFAALLFFRTIFSRKLRDEGEAGQVTGLRSFGGIYQYPYTSGWKRFLHSRKIYEMRHKDAARPGTETVRITRKIAARAQHAEASGVCMIVLGKPGGMVDGILKEQGNLLEKAGISSSAAYARDGIVSIDESVYSGMGTALLVTLSGTTTPDMVAEILARLKEYQVPVLGTEFLEVPAD